MDVIARGAIRRLMRDFEAPGVIPEVGAGHEAPVGEIDEVTIDGGAIQTEAGEKLDHIAVRERSRRRNQHLIGGDATRRGAQTDRAYSPARFLARQLSPALHGAECSMCNEVAISVA